MSLGLLLPGSGEVVFFRNTSQSRVGLDVTQVDRTGLPYGLGFAGASVTPRNT